MEHILRYFGNLDPVQKERFSRLGDLYTFWNAGVNVISRKDIGNLYLHHVLHSLSIARAVPFSPGTEILDLGTGGGFPGIPLAILLPRVRFTLIDSTAKKIRVVSEVISALGLENAAAASRRAEDEKGLYDFVVSRAVMPLKNLVKTAAKNISPENRNVLPNGVITLKGGDIAPETAPFGKKAEVTPVGKLFPGEDWFAGKYVIYIPC